MNAIREKAVVIDGLEDEYLDAVKPAIERISERFTRLSLKDEQVKNWFSYEKWDIFATVKFYMLTTFEPSCAYRRNLSIIEAHGAIANLTQWF